MKIEGKTAVVTGGSSGLGAAAARKLADAGARVAIFDRNEEAGREVAESIGGTFYGADVADEGSAMTALQQCVASLGPPRILVNCAGIALVKDIIDQAGSLHGLADFRRVIDVNLVGTFNMMQLFVSLLANMGDVEHERGVVINVSSIAGLDGADHRVAYVASKAAVAGMTMSCARNLSSLGIRVVCVAPGIFETPIVNDSTRLFLNQIPFPARMGVPEEFGDLVAYICTARYLNGEVIRLDGATRLGFAR